MSGQEADNDISRERERERENVIKTLHSTVQVQGGESHGLESGHLTVQHAGGRHPLPHGRGDPVAGAHLA